MSEPQKTDEPETMRRRLLRWCALGLGAVASAAMGIPVVGYLLGIVLKPEADEWIDLGPISQFPEKQTRLKDFDLPRTQAWDGPTKRASAYVRNLGVVKEDNKEKHRFQIFAVNCAHLGCPVAWFPQSGLFMCPCHGGVYYEDGSYASGPPPRGLFKYEDYEVKDGRLRIKGGHLPTLEDTFEKSKPGAKA